jgi:hypothetical protein
MNYDELTISVEPSGDITVTCMVDDVVYIHGSQTLEDPPEYAAAMCELKITRDEVLDYLYDKDINFPYTDWLPKQILKEVVLSFVEWKDKWKVANK